LFPNRLSAFFSFFFRSSESEHPIQYSKIYVVGDSDYYLHGQHERGKSVVVPDVEADIRLFQQIFNHLQHTVI
jgi:hypothetical protein